MNSFKKFIYFFLELQEKSLKKRLTKYLERSGANSTSKTVISNSATLTINSETEKRIEIVKKNVLDIVRSVHNDSNKLLDYIESKGTKVFKIDNADKLLSVIKEEEGLVTSLEGLEALYLCFITSMPLSLKTKPMFIMRDGEIDFYYMVHQFYKWYALSMNLPGFDFISQKLFKISLNSDLNLISNLNLEEMVGLQEAIHRDKEATEIALVVAQNTEGAQKALNKIKNGGASI